MLRIFSSLLAIFIINLLATPVAAAPSTSLSVNPSSQTIQVNETFNVNVMVNTGTNQIVSADLVLNFNPQVIEATNINLGSFMPGATEISKTLNNIDGKITYSFYTTRENAKSGQGILASLTLKAKAAGTSSVSFDRANTLIYGLGEGNVVSSISGAVYSINQPPAPPPPPGPPGPPPPAPPGPPGPPGPPPPGPGGGSADLNGNGRVDIFDLSILLRNWNKGGQGDLNGNGRVDIFDLSILLRNWNR